MKLFRSAPIADIREIGTERRAGLGINAVGIEIKLNKTIEVIEHNKHLHDVLSKESKSEQDHLQIGISQKKRVIVSLPFTGYTQRKMKNQDLFNNFLIFLNLLF